MRGPWDSGCAYRWAPAPGRGRQLAALGAAVLLAGGLAVAVTQAAGAQPQPSISSVRATINTLTGEFNKANQQYDQVEQQLSAAKGQLKQLTAQLAHDQKRYEDARKLVVQIADSTYEDSNSTSLAGLLTSSDPSQVLAESSIILQITGTGTWRPRPSSPTPPSSPRSSRNSSAPKTASPSSPHPLEVQGPHREPAVQAEVDPRLAHQHRAGGGAAGHGQQRRRDHQRRVQGPTGSQSDTAVAFVFKQLGCMYNYGATGPCSVGFDCSGLVMSAWAAAGITIPRDTYSQWAALPHISSSRPAARRPAVLQRHRPRRDVRRRRHDHRRAVARPAGPRAVHEHRLVRGQLRRRGPPLAVLLAGDARRPLS